MTEPDVIVVGAGAAGLFAAMAAAERGAAVVVLEKTSRVGTKILISGGGKCNVGHDGPLEAVIRAFDPPEALFIRPSCYRMPNHRILGLFTDAGLELYTRPDGRVFPVHGCARDVVSILLRRVLDLGVRVCLNTRVTGLSSLDHEIVGVKVSVVPTARVSSQNRTGANFGAKALLKEVLSERPSGGDSWSGPDDIRCGNVVVATGGSSYPGSGTTGDGWQWARSIGHSVIKPRAALAPIYLAAPFVHLSGVAIPRCRLIARAGSKRLGDATGDLLITHHGVSGPAALRLSRSAALAIESSVLTLAVDLDPGRSIDQVASLILEEGNRTPRRTILDWLRSVAPHRVADEMISTGLVEGTLPLSGLGHKNRVKLAEVVKSWSLGEVRAIPLEKGEVTAGGISLDEIDSKTMRSRLVGGLYLCGEVLDVAGPVGGYNLQAAFATGYQAGETAALDALNGRSVSQAG